MNALVLAAGFGTRLKPLTNTRAKALVQVAGVTLLERVLAALRDYGFRNVLVNVFYMADQILHFLKEHDFGLNVHVADERPRLLNTGGAIARACAFFQEDFLVHNVDVCSNIDLARLYQEHLDAGVLGTLAVSRVQSRLSGGLLIADSAKRFCGCFSCDCAEGNMAFCVESFRLWNFCGVHVLHPDLMQKCSEKPFAVFDWYGRVAAESVMQCYDVGEAFCVDAGTPEGIAHAETLLSARE